MTFPFFPNRSSSDDDALDQQLNEWATGSHTDPASDDAADALEFHRWADNTRRSDPAATGPAAGTWNRVLRNSAQESSKRSSEMSSTTLTAQSPGFSRIPEGSFRQRSGRYATLAATIAIVLAVAFGGWLAMSQMPGGGGDGRFAAIQGTPEVAQSQSCDVEPLTVDEVMEIVRNPYRYMYDRAESENREQSSYAPMADLSLAEALPMPNRWEAESANRSEPGIDEFNEATAFIDQYARCAEDATYGQYWALIHPIWVQSDILSAFPVFADEEQVRAQVEEVIGNSIDRGENSLKAFYNVYGSVTITANRNISEADRLLWSMSNDEPIILMGVRVTDENGEIIMETSGTGFPTDVRDGSVTLRPVIAVQRSSLTNDWYVLPWLGQYS